MDDRTAYVIQVKYPRTSRQWIDVRTIWPDATPEERLALLREERDRDRAATLEYRLVRRTVTEEIVATEPVTGTVPD